MPTCSNCDRLVDSQAIRCPHCQTPLKAFGHPGIPLHQAAAGTYLCDRCYYHQDDSCNYPQRPLAKTCTMFHDAETPLVAEPIQVKPKFGLVGFKLWCSRNRGLLIILFLITISIVLVVYN